MYELLTVPSEFWAIASYRHKSQPGHWFIHIISCDEIEFYRLIGYSYLSLTDDYVDYQHSFFFGQNNNNNANLRQAMKADTECWNRRCFCILLSCFFSLDCITSQRCWMTWSCSFLINCCRVECCEILIFFLIPYVSIFGAIDPIPCSPKLSEMNRTHKSHLCSLHELPHIHLVHSYC